MAHFMILMAFFASFCLSTTTKATCDLHAAIGIRLTLPFVFEKLGNNEKLVWLHNHTVIYQRDKGKVTVGQPDDVSSGGSLVLKNPKVSSAGVYQAQVHNASGSSMETWSNFVCVMEKVPKPTLSYNCDQKSVNFKCYTVKSHDLRYSWTMDDKSLTGETRSALTMPLSKLKAKNSFICHVSNQVSTEKSDAVYPVCASKPPLAQNELCFPKKTVLAVLAGAGGAIIVLVTIIIALCCCRRCNKQPKRREKVEPRMLALTPREPETDYETMHHVPEMPQEPSPKPSDHSDHSATKNGSEAVGDSLLPEEAARGADPSPVPKPRTRRPNTPDP